MLCLGQPSQLKQQCFSPLRSLYIYCQSLNIWGFNFFLSSFSLDDIAFVSFGGHCEIEFLTHSKFVQFQVLESAKEVPFTILRFWSVLSLSTSSWKLVPHHQLNLGSHNTQARDLKKAFLGKFSNWSLWVLELRPEYVIGLVLRWLEWL